MFEAIFQLVILILFIVSGILFLKTIQNTINVIQRQNRTMDPGDVWYMLIPVFNYYYYYKMINRVHDSIKNEMSDTDSLQKPPYVTGMIAATSLLMNFILNILEKLELLGEQIVIPALIAIVGFICWIIYWVQVNGWKNKLKSTEVII